MSACSRQSSGIIAQTASKSAEAAQLVIQAGAMGSDGDVFVLDMGEPVKITDLAERMIHLSGLSVKNDQNPDGDIEIVFSGLRPGEKLYEERGRFRFQRQTPFLRLCPSI